MKNRLSTFLIVILTTFMVTCTTPPAVPPAPLSSCGAWTVVSVTSSLGTSAIQPKFGQAVGGTLELPCGSSLGIYTLKTPAGTVTTGGTGTLVATVSSVTEGNLVLDTRVTFSYSNFTATSLTLVGDVTAGSVPVVSTQNVHTIILSRP